ncbi:MAG: DUF2530 domain-containing protein [Actinomycetes bacterium]
MADKRALRTPDPYRASAVPVIVVGTVAWAIALIVLLATGTDSWWRWACLAGFLLGVVGIPVMARYQRVHG